MAMKPFCGYHFADYFGHWLSFDKPGAKLPKIFHVNWFRKGAGGDFLWPGFGDNLRVLAWMIGRISGSANASATPIGLLPASTDLDTDGLSLTDEARRALFELDRPGWKDEMSAIAAYLDELGDRVPQALRDECAQIAERLA
jgi:phosphoenolpyruvate carboxykinase (GTP)